ncbi:MAG: hypothetical protein O8C66_08030 [Candidatus Methanoperedens sp.]|nr:hypothetical protein [Candidatus Methanoperedens sp.]MCZ7370444.1 hypothetical protein [Candidatus Methanoperedens sp.]
MIFRKILKNNDAVSISIGFMLMLAITVLIFSALIISFYTLSQRTEKSAMTESFRIIGSGLAIKITNMDTMVNVTKSYGGSVNSLEYEFPVSQSIAGKSYAMNITNSSYEIIIEAENGAKVVIPFNTSVNFIGRKIYSGAENYILYYNSSTDSINIEEQ